VQYLGGKSRTAKQIASFVTAEAARLRRPIWEPFCGALSVTAALTGPRLASDVRPDLIALYQAMRDGLRFPELDALTKQDYRAWKEAPPSPRRTFVGFGASFGGKWWGGLSYGGSQYRGRLSRENLERRISALGTEVELACLDFFAVNPRPGWVLYCDPPYRDMRERYYGCDFRFSAFDQKVLDWARFGPVFVSEYTFPHGEVVWEKTFRQQAPYGGGVRTDRLYRLGV
jgi:DNA adenine methylase